MRFYFVSFTTIKITYCLVVTSNDNHSNAEKVSLVCLKHKKKKKQTKETFIDSIQPEYDYRYDIFFSLETYSYKPPSKLKLLKFKNKHF